MIDPVEETDYKEYECVAYNELGTDRMRISLDRVGPPAIPYDVKLINLTHKSVTLAWKPGFDGGLPQTFKIGYRVLGTGKKRERKLLEKCRRLISVLFRRQQVGTRARDARGRNALHRAWTESVHALRIQRQCREHGGLQRIPRQSTSSHRN